MKRILASLIFSFCASMAMAQTATITQLTAPCHSDGVLVVNTTGFTGTLSYNYYLGASSVHIVHGGVSAATDTLRGWVGGLIFVEVNDSSAGASAAASFTGGPFHFSFTSVPAACPTLGTITANVTGGTGSYTYAWVNASGASMGSANPMSGPWGQYFVTVTDGAGCTLSSQYATDSGAFLNYVPPFYYTDTSTNASCTNGTATITSITGGTPPYSYLWSNGARSASITGLTRGTFLVTITDSNGCTADTGFLRVDQTPAITVGVTTTPATCLNNDGAIIAFGAGGASPYTYVWSNGATTQSQTGIAAGSYGVTATDANGCSGDGYGYIYVSTPITVTYATTPSSCTSPTGTATLTIGGGTAPYTVIWYTAHSHTGATISGMASGFYNFQVTDSVGCVQTGTVYIPPVDVITAGIGGTAATCLSATGSAAVYPSGGVAPYTYAWSTGATASSISSVVGGYYTVTITDVNGCSVTKGVLVDVASPVSLAFSTTPASCIFTSDGVITAIPYGGTAPYHYGWSTSDTVATITGRPAGLYSAYVTDAVGCTAGDTITLGYNAAADFCYCTISGTVYHDLNHDCTQDAGEDGINNIQIHCGGRGYTYTDSNGNYSFKVPSGTFDISQDVLSYYPLSHCQSNHISVTALAASGCVHVVNFSDSLNPIHDVHISTWDYNYAIPGHTYYQAMIVSNEGTATESSILEGYKSDGQLYAPTFSPSSAFGTGSGNWYGSTSAYPSLRAGASTNLMASYNVPTDIPLGTSVVFKDSVAYTSPMSNWLADYSPWDNVNYFITNIVASFDPNFVEVSPKGYGAAGTITYSDSTLEYMVHFQNTGTWSAQNIVVIDTIDANLDWSTLKPIYQSAKCKVDVSEGGVAKFTFTNINLPAQMYNDGGSNGMFTYTVKTRHALPIGTQFRNKAAIYFDYNKPVYTNTTLNTLGWPTSVPVAASAAATGSFDLYPNPTSNTFNIVVTSEQSMTYGLRVTDISGRTAINKSIAVAKGTETVSVDASSLPSGVYFVTLYGGEKLQTRKLVILK